MRIWAIGDLHLSFGTPNKGMEVFGPAWENHAEKIESYWKAVIHPDDLVLLPGDISWAMRLEEALIDLKWIDALPGTKVMIRGNHDYWWPSLKKLSAVLPPSIHAIHNNAFHWKQVSIGGSRLWDTPEYSFGQWIERRDPLPSQKEREELVQQEFSDAIFNRELLRLEMSLQAMHPSAEIRLAMTHYPPIGADLHPSRASQILKKYGIHAAVFGHLHSIREGIPLFGEGKDGIYYHLTSSDYLRYQPVLIL